MRNSILAVVAKDALQLGRILQARHLNQDAVDALPLDQGLDRAELVDAAFDDLDRLFVGLSDALGNGGLRHRETDQPAADIRDFKAALPGGTKQAAERLRQFTQLGKGRLQVGVLDADFDRVVTDRQAR